MSGMKSPVYISVGSRVFGFFRILNLKFLKMGSNKLENLFGSLELQGSSEFEGLNLKKCVAGV